MAKRKLEIEIIGDDKSFSRAIGRVGKSSDTLGSRVRKGAGVAAAALAGTLVGGAAAAAYGIKETAEAAEESNKVHAQTAAVLKSTGHAANLSQKDVESLAGSISRKTGIDDEAVQSGENLLLTFKDIRDEAGKGNDIFSRSSALIVDMSAALDQDLKSSAIQVGKALNDPIKGLTALQRVGVSFSEQQSEQIKGWVEEGDKIKAQKAILKELNSEFGGSAAAQATGLDKIKVSLGNVEESVGNVFLPLIEQGADTLNRDFVPQLQHTADKLSAIAGRKDIDLGKKLSLGGDVIKREWGDVPGEIGDVVDKTIPIVAARSGKLGIAIAEGTLHGFAESDVLGKIVIGLGATKLVGGPAGLIGIGKSVFGKELAEGAGLGFKAGLPIAIGAIGAANIATSAASGDMRDAGFELGGALIAGVAGAFLGGPAGAAIGAGLGSVAGELGSDLFGKLADSEKQLGPLQAQLKAHAQHAAAALGAQKQATKSLTGAEDAAVEADHRHRRSSEAVKEALQKKNHAVRQFGPDSKAARQAEEDLSHAQHRDAVTAQEAKDAHKLAGNELRLFKHRTVEAYDAEKQRIPGLQTMVAHLRKQYASEKTNYDLLENHLVPAEKALVGAKQKANHLVEEAGQKVGPKWAKSLEHQDSVQQQFGKHLQGLLRQIPEFGKKTETSTERAVRDWGHFGDVFSRQTGRAKGDVRSFDRATVTSLADIESKLNSNLLALGVKEVNFAAKQRGGTIREGRASGDSVPALLERGEYVLNRKAVRAIGTSTLDAINFSAAPRFQTGGSTIGAEPRLGGTNPLRGAGQNAIHRAYKAANAYYRRHDGIGRVIANGDRMDALHQPYLWGGGHGSTASRSGPWDCSGGISELAVGTGLPGGDFNFPPMVSGGFESWGLPGAGDFTVLANAEHVYGVLKTPSGLRAIGTSEENPGGGFGWIDGYTFRPGFTIRHADFGATGGRSAGGRRDRKGQPQRKGFQKGGVVSGKVSFFGGGEENSGMDTSQPGIAVNLKPGTDSGWDNPTTRGWMEQARAGHPVYAAVTIAGKSANLPITDLGPAGFTGRAIDVTEGGVRKLGFTTSNFPTDAVGKAVIGGSGSGSESAKEKKEKEREAIKAHAIAGGRAIWAPSLKATPLPGFAKGLSKGIREQLAAPGITYSGKVGVSELALSQTEDEFGQAQSRAAHLRTQGQKLAEQGDIAGAQTKYAEAEKAEKPAKKHEEAVLRYQQKLFEGRRKQLKTKLHQVEKQLSTVHDPAKQKALLGKAQHLREELGTVQGDLSGVRSTRSSLSEPVEGLEAGEAGPSPEQEATERQTEAIEKAAEEQRQRDEEAKAAVEAHTEAIKELQKTMAEETAIGSSELAVSGATVMRALADLVSGQMGPNIAHQRMSAGAGALGTV